MKTRLQIDHRWKVNHSELHLACKAWWGNISATCRISTCGLQDVFFLSTTIGDWQDEETQLPLVERRISISGCWQFLLNALCTITSFVLLANSPLEYVDTCLQTLYKVNLISYCWQLQHGFPTPMSVESTITILTK